MYSRDNFDIKLMLGLFGASIVINYFLPSFIGYSWFIGLLFAFFISKNQNNYFWIVFFWLILSSPGYLFYKLGEYHLPIISIPGLGRDVFYDELFAILTVIKAFSNPVKQTVFYRQSLIIIVLYALFLLLMGLLSGTGIITVLKSVRHFIPILLLLMIPRMIPYNYIPRVFLLMFVCSFIMLAAQLFDIAFGHPLASSFGETQIFMSGTQVNEKSEVFDVSKGAIRTIYGPFLLLFSLVMGIVLLNENKKTFKPWFLYLVSFLSALSIFLSATRGWIVAAVLLLIGLAYFKTKKFATYSLTGLIIILLAFSVPKFRMQISQSFERVLTLESLASGDLTAGGTLKRLTERGPRVMKKFREKPVLGFGFSDDYYKYADVHVGNQTLLLNGGIVGFLIFIYFIFFLLYWYFKAYTLKNNKAMLIFILGLMALVAVHSSSGIIFSYAMNTVTAISLSLFFFFSDYYFKGMGEFTQKNVLQGNLNNNDISRI